MDYVHLGKIKIPLEKSYAFCPPELPEISQDDYVTAITSVYLASDARKAVQNVMVAEGEHQLNRWTVGDTGKYTGAWSKRFAKYVYKTSNIKLDPRTVSVISERVRKALLGLSMQVKFLFSDQLWKPGEFGEKENSCWFGGRSYGHSSTGLIGSGRGGAIKIFTQEGYKRGRCWFYNVDDSLLIFNAYDKEGTMDILSIARMLSTHFHMQYCRHNDVILDKSYVNGNVFWAIGDPPITRAVSLDFALRAYTTPPHLQSEITFSIPSNLSCCICDGMYNTVRASDGKMYCAYHRFTCCKCQALIPFGKDIQDIYDEPVCLDCAQGATCPDCNHYIGNVERCPLCNAPHQCQLCNCPILEDAQFYRLANDDIVCQRCADDCCIDCSMCGNMVINDNSTYIEQEECDVCDACYSSHYAFCERCEHHESNDNFTTVHDETMCTSCADDASFICDRCGEREWRDDCEVVEHQGIDETWCAACSERHASHCNDCDLTYASDDGHDCPNAEEEEDE